LDKKIAEVVRKIAKKIASGENYNKQLGIDDIREYLGAPKYLRGTYEGNAYAGVVTGLAWTSVGGKILYVESSVSKGKGLNLTGNLGQVMKESAIIALEYLKAHAKSIKINEDIFNHYGIHVHVPEGAIPKDGPSAGITMVTSMASAFTQRRIRAKLAMTGEMTLRGKVLPVGGIKEKILAAKRADIKEIILSKDNEKDINEINEIYLRGLKFHYVEHISEVLDIALLSSKVKNPIEFKVKREKKGDYGN
jgi:ATP-dependent Lon protease